MMEATLNDPQWSRMFMVSCVGRGAGKNPQLDKPDEQKGFILCIFFCLHDLVVLNHGLTLDCRVPVPGFVFVCPEVLILYLSRSCKAITEV